MRFLVDAQLPPLLADWLIEQGHEASHVAASLSTRARDDAIWLRASATGAALIMRDGDFLAIRLRSSEGAPIVWLRIGNATNAALISWLSGRLEHVVSRLETSDYVVEVL